MSCSSVGSGWLVRLSAPGNLAWLSSYRESVDNQSSQSSDAPETQMPGLLSH